MPFLFINIFDPLMAPIVIAVAIIGSSPLIYVPVGVIVTYGLYRWVRA